MIAALVGGLAGLVVILVVPGRARVASLRIPRSRLVGSLSIGCSAAATFLLLRENVSWLVVTVMIGTTVAAVRALRRRRARGISTRRRDQVLAACEGLAADLAAGLVPQHALRAMAEEWPELDAVADAAVLGADVPTAFRTVAALPGASMLGLVAAAWEVAHRSGAGLVDTVRFAADTVRSERETARVVATELAAAKATARLLALLPLGVLVLGRGLGGSPFGFLLTSTAGQVCLTLGLGLTWAGSVWLERIADTVERR